MFRKVTILFVFVSLQTCFISPEIVDKQLNTADDFSASTRFSVQTDFTFNDFITSVYQADDSAKQALVDSFIQWADSTSGIPYIEDTTAYFLYFDASAPAVAIAGDFNGWDPEGQNFTPLPGTNLLYKAAYFESDARLDYKFVLGNDWILDPLNPHVCRGGFGPNSEIAMPDYLQPLEILDYEIPLGNMNTSQFSDSTQGRTRNVRVYTPPGYEGGTLHYRSIYFHDGSEYLQLGYAKNILDYMIFNEMIPPLVAVFVDPTDRNTEYAYDMDFMEMFVNELVPWVDAHYRTMTEPQYRAVAGVSLGGLTSLLFTLRHPDVFGNCGAYSPAVQLGNLIADYGDSKVLPVKIYMDAGTYESAIFNSADVLQRTLGNNSWDYQWKVWHEGHSWGAWRAHLDESLTYFWPLVKTGIDERYGN